MPGSKYRVIGIRPNGAHVEVCSGISSIRANEIRLMLISSGAVPRAIIECDEPLYPEDTGMQQSTSFLVPSPAGSFNRSTGSMG